MKLRVYCSHGTSLVVSRAPVRHQEATFSTFKSNRLMNFLYLREALLGNELSEKIEMTAIESPQAYEGTAGDYEGKIVL